MFTPHHLRRAPTLSRAAGINPAALSEIPQRAREQGNNTVLVQA